MPDIIINQNDNSLLVLLGEVFEGVREGTARSLDGSAEHVRVFKVKVMIPEMSETAVALCPGLPLLGSTYLPPDDPATHRPKSGVAFDPLALCVRISAKQQDKDDWQIWLVSCFYSRNIPIGQARSSDPEGVFNDPTMEGAEIFWEWGTIQEAKESDLNGTPYLNMANQPFTPPRVGPLKYPVLVIRRNEATMCYQQLLRYVDALNDAEYMSAPRGCVQMDEPKVEMRNRGRLVYWNYTYRLKFRPPQNDGGYVLPPLNVLLQYRDETTGNVYWIDFADFDALVDSWQPLILNQGMYRLGSQAANDLQGVWGKPVPIMKWGQQVHHPVLLDQFGQECKAQTVGNAATLSTGPPPPGGGLLVNHNITNLIRPWWMQFIEYRYVSFSSLMNVGAQSDCCTEPGGCATTTTT